MQEAVFLITNQVLFALGATLLAFICALPGFLLDLFYDISKYKNYLFFGFALIVAFINTIKNGIDSGFLINILLNLAVVYFGLLILIAFKNMASRFGACKMCDQIKAKLRKKIWKF